MLGLVLMRGVGGGLWGDIEWTKGMKLERKCYSSVL